MQPLAEREAVLLLCEDNLNSELVVGHASLLLRSGLAQATSTRIVVYLAALHSRDKARALRIRPRADPAHAGVRAWRFPNTAGRGCSAITLQGVTLVAALVASRIGALQVRIVAAGVAIIVIASFIALVGGGSLGPAPAKSPRHPARGAGAGGDRLRALPPHLRADGIVTVQTMFGVLCIYLLIGLFFASGYGLIEAVSDSAFFATGFTGDSSDFLYFSFATLTTVGYGDLTAATDLGRSLAITEALIGQIYLVTVVALIVSNIGRARRAETPPSPSRARSAPRRPSPSSPERRRGLGRRRCDLRPAARGVLLRAGHDEADPDRRPGRDRRG